jgi:hypothetical protein
MGLIERICNGFNVGNDCNSISSNIEVLPFQKESNEEMCVTAVTDGKAVTKARFS